VLLVEPRWLVRLRSAAAVRRAGARVLLAAHSRQALRFLANGRIDIALLDLDASRDQAYDILNTIQGDTPHVYTVACSATAQDADLEACFASGFDDFLSKPFSADRLRVVIDAASDARSEDLARLATPFVTDSDFHSPELHGQLIGHLREETDTLYAMLRTPSTTRVQLGRRMHRIRSGLLLVGLRALADECLDLERDCELAHVEESMLYRRGWRVARQMRAISAAQIKPLS
jgi:CheY-like chemotaxis protein